MDDRRVHSLVSAARMTIVEIPEGAAGVVFWVAVFRWLYVLVSHADWALLGIVSAVAAVSGYGTYRLARREHKRLRTGFARQRLLHPLAQDSSRSLTDALIAAIPSQGLMRASVAAIEDAASGFASDGFVRDYYLYVAAGAEAAEVSIQASIVSPVRQLSALYYFPGDRWENSELYASEELEPPPKRHAHEIRGWREALVVATENAAAEVSKATHARWQVSCRHGNTLTLNLRLDATSLTWVLRYRLAAGALWRDDHEIGTLSE